jgi:uncharacterized protein YjbI with pentapeptide repeats
VELAMPDGWTEYPMWRILLTSETDLDHQDWLNAGRKGEGQVALKNRNLNGTLIRGSELSFSQFINCHMRGAELRSVNFENAELSNCHFDNSVSNGHEFETLMYACTFDRAKVDNCQFTKTRFNLSHFIGTHIQDGDWAKTDLDTTTWNDAEVERVSFQGSHWGGSRLYNTRFIQCDFRGGKLFSSRAFGTFFDKCDFRKTELTGLSLKNATFYRCGFYGCINKPNIEGAYTIVEPDLSENFDGSNIADPQEFYRHWGAAPIAQPV